MSKRTVVVIVAAAAAIVGAVAIILVVVNIYGGTPIIIKGFDDGSGGESITIEGSPSAESQTTAGKKDHLRGDPIERLYVLQADGTCVDYLFGSNSEPQIRIDVIGATEEIDLTFSKDLKRHNLRFDDVDTYHKTGNVYKRNQSGVIEKVRIDPDAATCTDINKKPIKCPTEFIGSNPLTIGVNYRDSKRCTR